MQVPVQPSHDRNMCRPTYERLYYLRYSDSHLESN